MRQVRRRSASCSRGRCARRRPRIASRTGTVPAPQRPASPSPGAEAWRAK